MENYIIGTAAAIFTTFGFVPQIVKMYRTKSAKDVSTITFVQFSIGVILWILYGVNIRDLIITVSNSITLVTLVVAIILCYYYKK